MLRFDLQTHWRPGSESRVYMKKATETRPELRELYEQIIRDIDAARNARRFRRELAAKMGAPEPRILVAEVVAPEDPDRRYVKEMFEDGRGLLLARFGGEPAR